MSISVVGLAMEVVSRPGVRMWLGTAEKRHLVNEDVEHRAVVISIVDSNNSYHAGTRDVFQPVDARLGDSSSVCQTKSRFTSG
ncbi:hypothetical protein [Mycolicibacterium lutetiense]|uniref:Uncharacterized protein n=1 Tax=Mycolicibacterium lutetiense TaxID=1641992 RepID=A0ABS4ZSD5_9MYCO|nr:hypothetical protein [Mycolicibacterium lutetiense]MBP2452421.1 hypothetical protein [Mycolicibacterium lutetiense]